MSDISELTDDQLDKAVAKEVMGYQLKPEIKVSGYAVSPVDTTVKAMCFYPTRDIAQAWQVVERMRKHHKWTMILDNKSINPDNYGVIMQHIKRDGTQLIVTVDDKPAPRSICEAALAAVRGGAR